MRSSPAAGLLSPFVLFVALGVPALQSPDALGAASAASPLKPQGLFESNQGQYPAQVAYRARFERLDAAIRADGSVAIYPSLRSGSATRELRIVAAPATSGPPVATGLADYRTNYLRGEAGSITDVPHYRQVSFREAYRGIDLAYHAGEGKLEFDFVVAPGADPAQIRMRIDGADVVRVRPNGDLAVESDGVTVLQRRPLAYQVREGKRVPVDCSYRVGKSGMVSIALGRYDRKSELVIDPVVEYSSYLGGSASDGANAIRQEFDGFVYVTGTTVSSNFPVVAALDSSLTGAPDVFVTKINPATGKAVYSTYIGGRDGDNPTGITSNTSGEVYITGISGSRYPTTSGAYRTSGSGTLGFVTKLNAAGNLMAYSTLVPGTRPAAITVDPFGQAIITGNAGTAFTTTPGAFQPVYGGNGGVVDATTMGDAFVLKLSASGNAAIYASFFGGAGTESGAGVAIDISDRVAIAGGTTSTNLPLANAYQGALRGSQDGFLAVFAPGGATLAASTYFGGINTDSFTGLGVDLYGNVLVSGTTRSDDLPTLNALLPRTALQTRYGSTRKGFVAKFAVSPLQLVFSTYTGSRSNCCDTAFGIAVDLVGDVYVTGNVAVAELPVFQSVNPFMSASYVAAKFNGSDVRESSYVAGYSRDGQRLRYQTLVAPCYDSQDCDRGAISARMPGQVAVAGSTDTDWLPVSRLNTQAKISSTPFITDAWVMTLVTENPKVQLDVSAPSSTTGTPVVLTATTYTNAVNGTVTFWDDTTSVGTAPMVEGVAQLSTTFAPGVRRLTATFNADRTPLRLLAVSPSTGSCQ